VLRPYSEELTSVERSELVVRADALGYPAVWMPDSLEDFADWSRHRDCERLLAHSYPARAAVGPLDDLSGGCCCLW
jgi:hypothetical protein